MHIINATVLTNAPDRWTPRPRLTIHTLWTTTRVWTPSTRRVGSSGNPYVPIPSYPFARMLIPHQLNYHLYTQPRPEALQSKYFVSDDIREELQQRAETIVTGPPAGLNLPDELQGYHSLVPLEPVVGERRKFGNWYSSTYKAVNTADGFTYVLKRVESASHTPFGSLMIELTLALTFLEYRLNSQSAFGSVEAWSRIKHPNLVGIKEAFTTRAFNDDCELHSHLSPFAHAATLLRTLFASPSACGRVRLLPERADVV